MRIDENGNQCPGTLGEYLEICKSIAGEDNDAVAWLKDKIANSPHGENEVVLAHDHQMRMLLMPRLLTRDGRDII